MQYSYAIHVLYHYMHIHKAYVDLLDTQFINKIMINVQQSTIVTSMISLSLYHLHSVCVQYLIDHATYKKY